MSRRLAVVVGSMISREGSRFQKSDDRSPHLFVIDQDSGKGLVLRSRGSAQSGLAGFARWCRCI
jgi:hypothetical protein